MIKTFCDGCKKEIPSTSNRGSFSMAMPGTGTRMSVEVMVTINGTTNGGHTCTDCIIKVVNEGGFSKSSTR